MPPSSSHSRASEIEAVFSPESTFAISSAPAPPSSSWPNSRNGSRAVRQGASGIRARRRVPAPGGLVTSSVPPSASIRLASPARPEPAAGSAPPAPSSETSATTRSAPCVTSTRTRVAPAYLTALESASLTR